jgi:hypothetical protein
VLAAFERVLRETLGLLGRRGELVFEPPALRDADAKDGSADAGEAVEAVKAPKVGDPGTVPA